MKKTLVVLGASMIMFGALNVSAEARRVHYEINGKRYSYNTSNRAEAAEAKKRIAAAKVAEEAKAKADAEKAKYPLRAVFLSSTQKEAWQAQEKLKELLSEGGEDAASSKSSVERRAERRSKRADTVREASAAGSPQKPAPQVQEATPPRVEMPATIPAIAEPIAAHSRAKVRSVSFDVETGIKTTFMVDGTITEEPFDSSALSALVPENEGKSSLVAFVNRLRQLAPEETTGSIRTSVAEPESKSAYWHR